MELMEYLQQPWLYAVLSATYALSIVTVIIVILGENRNPVKSLAWVTILILLPAVGLILYIFFGRNIKNKRMLSRRNKRKLLKLRNLPVSHRYAGLTPEQKLLAEMGSKMCNAPYYPGNSIEIYTTGEEKFEQLKADLLAAEKFINLQYYIFENDKIGLEIAEILKQKARSGVKVRVIYDHVGSFHVSSHFFKDMRKAGVEAYPFFKVAFIPFASKVNWRNHRKIVVIDGKTGYIGGMNVADRYVDGGKFERWRDCHLRIEGPAVESLQYSFARDWVFMGRELPEDSCDATTKGSVGVQTLTAGPMSQWSNVGYLFMRAIISAKQRVYLQTPYFMPPDGLLKALQIAALSGVDVRVMIPLHSDSRMLSYASRSYITECLRAGVKFYLYEAGMLHSKVLIIDEDFASVGSSNYDFRSFEHNFEGNSMLYSGEINQELRRIFKKDQQDSMRVDPEKWRKRPWIHRAMESVMRLLSPIL